MGIKGYHNNQSQTKVPIDIVVGPFVFFLLLRFGGFPLHPSIFDSDIGWFWRLLLLLVHFLQVIVFVLSSGLVFHLDSFQLPGILLIVETHIFTEEDQEP